MLPIITQGQDLCFQHFSTHNGLPSNEVYQSFQDSKGFLWFCTDQGLARYNGYSFDYFSTDDGLTDNTIFNGYEDAHGKIWWVTFRGGLCYYEQGAFHPHPANEAIMDLCKGDYLGNLCSNGDTLFFAPKNRFPIVADTTLLKAISVAYYYSIGEHSNIHQVNLTLPVCKHSSNLYSYQQSLTPIGTHQLFYLGISHYRSIAQFNLVDSFSFTPDQNRLLLSSMPLGHQAIQPNQYLVYYKNHLGILSKQKLVHHTHLPVTNTFIYHATRDQQSNIWVATNQGIFLYLDGDFSRTPQHFLQPYTISHINEDSEGNLWFTTLNNGVKMLPSLNIRQYKTSSELEFSRLLAVDKHYILSLAKTGELYLLSPQKSLTAINYGNSHKQNAPIGFELLDTQTVLLGNGMAVNIQEKKATQYLKKANSKAFFFNKTLDKLFIGSHLGITYKQNEQVVQTSYQERTNCFYPHQDSSKLWLGSSKGLALYDMHNDTFHQHLDPLLKNRILDIGANDNGILFLATKGAGLLIKQKEKVYQLNSKKGLCSNFIQCVAVQNDSTI